MRPTLARSLVAPAPFHLGWLAALAATIYVCAAGACRAPTPPPPCAGLAAGDVVITEIFADHADGADAGHEWIELYGAAGAAVDLAGATVTVARPDDSSARAHVVGDAMLAPGAYLVLGDVAPDQRPAWPAWIGYGYGGDLGELPNRGGVIALACDGVTIDRVAYGAVTRGRSWQLDGAAAPTAATADDPARWCAAPPDGATELEPMDFGTPGAANPPCPIAPPPGACVDAASGQVRAIARPAPGQLAISEWMPDPSGAADAAGEWIEVEARADVDLNGLQLGADALVERPVIDGAACVPLARGARALFARTVDPARDGGLDAIAGTFGFALRNRDGAARVGVAGAEVDAVTWAQATAGRSRQRGDDDRQCDAPAGTSAYDGVDVGTPGAPPEVPCP